MLPTTRVCWHALTTDWLTCALENLTLGKVDSSLACRPEGRVAMTSTGEKLSVLGSPAEHSVPWRSLATHKKDLENTICWVSEVIYLLRKNLLFLKGKLTMTFSEEIPSGTCHCNFMNKCSNFYMCFLKFINLLSDFFLFWVSEVRPGS